MDKDKSKDRKNNVLVFRPLEHLSAEENVRRFVDQAKNELTIFGPDLDWESTRWDISNHTTYRGNKASVVLVWTNFESTKSKTNKILLVQPFLDFAKAYIRYMQAIQQSKQSLNHLMALRALEKALRDSSNNGNACPTNISPDTLNQAVRLLKEKYKNPYAQANALQGISDFVCEKKLSILCLPWKNPIKFQDTKARSSGQEGVDYSKDKCPTDACIRAVAEIYCNSKSPVDKFATSTAVIQFANPCRIGEVLTMPADCEIEDIYGEDGGYAIKIIPEKTDKVMIKQILPSWIDLTKQAIGRLKDLSEIGREMARWYEQHPDRMYLPVEYRDLRDENYLPSSVVKELLGLNHVTYVRFIKDNNIELIRGARRKRLGFIQGRGTLREAVVSHIEVSKAICALLPDDFPYMDKELKLKYSDSLFVVPWNFFRREKFVYSKVMFQSVTYMEIGTQYGMKPKSMSMFDWNELYEDDGTKIRLDTHAPRHWQNTIANYNHIPELFIALWSGKFNTKMNEPYDGRSEKEKFQQATEVLGESFIMEAESPSPPSIYTRPGFISSQLSQFGTFQVTEAGWCGHDFTMSPCRKMGDSGIHICCSEHYIMKGDPRNKLLHLALEEEEAMLNFVETESKDESLYGVDVWHVFHRQKVDVLRAIVGVLDNQKIPNGTFFRMILDNEYSPQRIAVYNKTGKVIGSNSNNVQVALVGQYNFNDGALAIGA